MYALVMAEVHSVLADGPLPTPTMHPDVANASFGTVPHHTFSIARSSHYQRTFWTRLNILYTSEAWPSV
jgi:hypothetical protein